ncbi:oplophorus-luciferin 2-monooxygenase non-catalytic subunit [Rhipicephalus sanguineus]|uniref:oplophorus-luciferin 2-monooxygenase non-catalytic subunit n=1 Tax=Rhipicephalus sanguineus TaxID=34632 RepID=UPI0018933070|nr:oplophorus-luciferin 2-monooxygenase non-catalytic subunit [Rhipicephalus sanguineus]
MGSSRVLFKCILLYCIAALAAAQLNPCPAPESLSPCGCDFTGINCVKAKNVSQLARAFSGREKVMHKALWIQSVPVDAIGAGIFGDYAFGKVYIEICNLTSFELSALNNSAQFLSELSLFGNQLTGIDYKRIAIFEKLRLLNLAKNNINNVPAFAFKNPSLQTLMLNENPISSIGAFAFRNLPNLKEIQLRSIRVKMLAAYSFTIPRHNPLLQIILSAGKLESIEEKAFHGVAPFTLRLTLNKLEEFSRPVFQPLMEAMTQNAKRINQLGQARIETRGNRFTCKGCSFSWLTTLQGRPDLYLMLFDFRCRDMTSVWNVTNSLIGCPRGGK